MTASLIDVTARVMARAYGRAIPIRRTSSISPDPENAFGIAPVRMVSEEQVQAIAFGLLNGTPSVAVRWNPLSRDPGELGSFASALDDYITDSVRSGVLPRIWVPHAAALEALDMLGHRMDGNRSAAPNLQRMGALCRAIVIEHEFPDQQVLAVAGALLAAHAVTGQAPIEDGHVRALVAWIHPVDGIDPREEAACRSLTPANAMLQREIDDEVERLRKIGKGRSVHALDAQREVENLLRKEALREWDILIEGRRAFLSLGLVQAEGVAGLVENSFGRFSWSVAEPRSAPRRPVALRRRLQDIEASAARVQDLDARSDPQSRERMRRDGRVIAAMVEQVIQPERRRRPECLIIRSDQDVQRVRKGTVMKTGDDKIRGRVTRVSFDATTGDSILELSLKKGGRNSAHYAIGNQEDWFTTDVYEPWNQGINKIIEEAQAPLVFGELAPAASSKSPSKSLVEAAEKLRRADD